MTTATAPSAADLLVELDRLDVRATLKGDRIGLQPASRLPADTLSAIRDRKADLAAMLADPRRRWKGQAEALLTTVDDPALREDLQHVFDEREAIASVDGGLDDACAGHLAYGELAACLLCTAQQEGTP